MAGSIATFFVVIADYPMDTENAERVLGQLHRWGSVFSQLSGAMAAVSK